MRTKVYILLCSVLLLSTCNISLAGYGDGGLTNRTQVVDYLKAHTQWPGEGNVTPDKMIQQWADKIMATYQRLVDGMGDDYIRSEGGHDVMLKRQTDLLINNEGVRKGGY